jgi:hypothetical protein
MSTLLPQLIHSSARLDPMVRILATEAVNSKASAREQLEEEESSSLKRKFCG